MNKQLGAFIILLIYSLLIFPVFASGEADYSTKPRDIIIKMETYNEHETGILRLTNVPQFVLYGDGRLIVSRPDQNDNTHLYEANLSPDEVEFLLKYINMEKFQQYNENYLNLTVDGLETTYITVNTKNIKKTIKIYGASLAAYQNMIPQGLVNIWRKLGNYSHENETEFIPDKVSLFVYPETGDIPEDTKVEGWRVRDVDLSKLSYGEDSLLVRYKETVFDDPKIVSNIIKNLKNKTLYNNRAAFYRLLFKNGGKYFRVGFKPILPYQD